MPTIAMNYGGMSASHADLISTWNRIEARLAELESIVAGTQSMSAEVLRSYVLLKKQWDAAATDRQLALKGLADTLEVARTHYQDVDRRVASMFLA